MPRRCGALLVLVAACHTPLSELDGAFYSWDGRSVHCAVEIDDRAGWNWQDLADGLDRARDNGEVLEVLVHRPGESMTWQGFEQLLAGARDRQLAFVTATEMMTDTPTAGIALMYDDWYLDTWLASLPLLAQYGARATIYVAHYDGFSDVDKGRLHQLADAGNDIEAHSILHLRGPGYVEDHGVGTYLAEEVVPSIDLLAGDGFPVTSFAYPFGMRTSELDEAILATHKVTTVRALSRPPGLRASSCPQ